MKICEYAIYELLKGLAGGRVYAMRAPQNGDLPFIVYQRIDGDRWRSINAPSGIAQVTIQVDVYATGYYEMKELAAQVETILDGHRGDVYYGTDSPQTDFVRVAGISLQNDVDIFEQTAEPFLFRSMMQYLVTYEQ